MSFGGFGAFWTSDLSLEIIRGDSYSRTRVRRQVGPVPKWGWPRSTVKDGPKTSQKARKRSKTFENVRKRSKTPENAWNVENSQNFFPAATAVAANVCCRRSITKVPKPNRKKRNKGKIMDLAETYFKSGYKGVCPVVGWSERPSIDRFVPIALIEWWNFEIIVPRK